MTSLRTPPPDVLEYLQSVRATLADLPPEERDELMVDVETALLEASEEDDGPLAARLGPPETFAADLRAAAGLEAPPVPAAAATVAAPSRASASERLRATLATARDDPRTAAVRRVAGDLAPIWWVARALVAYAAVALALGARMSVLHPSIPAVRDRPTTLAVVGLVVAASLWLGLRHRRARWMLAVNVVLALIALPLAIHLAGRDSVPAAASKQAARAANRSSAGSRTTFTRGTINTAPLAASGAAGILTPNRATPLSRTTPVPPRPSGASSRTTPAPPAAATPAGRAPRGTTTPVAPPPAVEPPEGP